MTNNKLELVIGEIPVNIPNEFSTIEMYYRKDDNSLEYYGTINSMFNFNYISPVLFMSEDPRYYLEEGHTENGCKFNCILKATGKNKGLYRLINGTPYLSDKFDSTTELKLKRK